VANRCDEINMPLEADNLTRVAHHLSEQDLELKELYSDALNSILSSYRISPEKFHKYPDVVKDVIYQKVQEEVAEIISEPWKKNFIS
jgi:hypothetical protein